jgi:hypothetical protein
VRLDNGDVIWWEWYRQPQYVCWSDGIEYGWGVLANYPDRDMSNQQPWYHQVEGLLFTATRPIDEKEFLEHLAKLDGVVPGTPSIEMNNGYCEPEPGDPHDLM